VAKIVYSNRSIQDLDEIGDYIAETLKSPTAALNVVNKIQDIIDTLADFPFIGSLLSTIADISDSDYRLLVCENYLAFYHVSDNIVYIDRIIYGRRDYVAIFFPQ
jgi:addiction module RelE/StbE family toxin